MQEELHMVMRAEESLQSVPWDRTSGSQRYYLSDNPASRAALHIHHAHRGGLK
jgi:hypothetical protein